MSVRPFALATAVAALVLTGCAAQPAEPQAQPAEPQPIQAFIVGDWSCVKTGGSSGFTTAELHVDENQVKVTLPEWEQEYPFGYKVLSDGISFDDGDDDDQTAGWVIETATDIESGAKFDVVIYQPIIEHEDPMTVTVKDKSTVLIEDYEDDTALTCKRK